MIENSAATGACGEATVDSELHQRAACLINPVSGIANDFLNHFNEILLLVENLPMLLPEMVDELLEWQPSTYSDYFNRSRLPGSVAALARYATIEPASRAYFDDNVSRLNAMAVEIVAEISEHRAEDGVIPPEKVSGFCEIASARFRAELDLLAGFVNCGHTSARSGM